MTMLIVYGTLSNKLDIFFCGGCSQALRIRAGMGCGQVPPAEAPLGNLGITPRMTGCPSVVGYKSAEHV